MVMEASSENVLFCGEEPQDKVRHIIHLLRVAMGYPPQNKRQIYLGTELQVLVTEGGGGLPKLLYRHILDIFGYIAI